MRHIPHASSRTPALLTFGWLALTGCATAKPPRPIDMTTTSATVTVAAPALEATPAASVRAPATPIGVLNEEPPRVDATLSDGQIAAIASSLHQAEIDAGTVALAHADRVEVKRYAQRLLTVHANAASKIRAIVDNQNLILTDSQVGDSVKRVGVADVEALKALSSREFDGSFLAGRLQHEQRDLGVLDDTLIPNALNPLLKEALVATRVQIAQNIELAKHELAALPAQ